MVGISPVMQQIRQLVDRVSSSVCPVLIEGESGTGKELVARRLHSMSERSGRTFIPVNCAGISEGLFESQFFGHLRGAFTGARQEMLGLIRAADGGSLFMDEVGEIPLHQQAKMLRVFQEGEVLPVGSSQAVQVDTRFIAATNRNLEAEVTAGRFRRDLFYRLNIVRIHIPPLRERPEDIEPLLDHFLGRFSEQYNRPAVHVSGSVRHRLEEYSWPGNVRQLAAWVERLYALGFGPEILVGSLVGTSGRYQGEPGGRKDKVMTLKEAERHAIRKALEHSGNRIQQAAEILDIHRTTLYRKMRMHNL
ncbi:MAG: sigma-54 interaction domain-containing protein [Phycisphaerae bacterium]